MSSSDVHKQNILNIVNTKENTFVTLADVDFGLPQTPTDPNPIRNTFCVVTSRSHSGFYGYKVIWYNRIHESELSSFTVPRNNANVDSQLLPAINSKYNLNITIDDINDKTIITSNTGNITISLDFKDNSYLIYKGPVLNSQPIAFIARNDLVWDPLTATTGLMQDTNNPLILIMDSGIQSIKTTPALTGGKRYAEFITHSSTGVFGVCSGLFLSTESLVYSEHAWSINPFEKKIYENGNVIFDLNSYGSRIDINKPIGVLLNLDNRTLALLLEDNLLVNISTISLPSGDIFFTAGNIGLDPLNTVQNFTSNFGQTPFYYSPLIGY